MCDVTIMFSVFSPEWSWTLWSRVLPICVYLLRVTFSLQAAKLDSRGKHAPRARTMKASLPAGDQLKETTAKLLPSNTWQKPPRNAGVRAV